jgi:hypothetical protein
VTWYGWLVGGGLVYGLAVAVAFLAVYRPRRPMRLEAVAVYGWPVLLGLLMARSLILLVLRWPPSLPQGMPDAIVGIGLLGLCDALLTVMFVSYWRYARGRRGRSGRA